MKASLIKKAIEGGEAVYIARAMLHLDLEDYYLLGLRKADVTEIATNLNLVTIKVNPNPAKNEIEVSSNKSFNKIIIADIYGRTVSSTYAMENTLSRKMVISSIPNGVYIAQLYNLDLSIGNAKLIISK
ncbi:MAG: T9SS type A sorting domain-containing protein [Bacteroidetes bacterium]|nr:T9SS type A sorting domain-containing protein [Bacteroidota bacterium]